jgi:HEAT repeat protein
LFDFSGDDVYNGGSFSCGSGYFGFGLLYDGGGSDKYYGDTHTQGVGTFGMGTLIDISGTDRYSAALFAQGVGLTEGLGAVIDFSGSDSYIAGNKYKESIGLAGVDVHYLSLSQGFAYGLRPYLSGGIGALIDFEGNDYHISDIYGQGASYWWGLGMLYDSGGNDQYLSYQYSQGSGTHMSLGILFDESGNDFYRGKGLMQGCGHDYACGLILDRHGDDIYQACDLSQAAGSANGIGILIDDRGDDTYYVKRTSNTQGYGNPRREFGSIGLFIDLEGQDRYVGNGADDSFWKTDSKWGGGMDIALVKSDTIIAPESQSLEVETPQAESIEEKVDMLFVMASSGELKYRGMVQSAIDSIIAMGAAAVPGLIEKYKTKDARENHTINKILVGIGKDGVKYLVKSLSLNNPEQVSRVCRSLGEIGDSAAVDGLINVAIHPDWRVRSGACVALGKIGDNKANEAALQLLSDTNEIVRKSAAVSCRRLKNEEAIPVLVHTLGDSFYGAALCASEALIEFGEKAIGPIADSLNSDNILVGNLGCTTLGRIGDITAAVAIASQLDSDSPVRRALAVEGILLSNSSSACGFVELMKDKEKDPTVLFYIEKVLEKYAAR